MRGEGTRLIAWCRGWLRYRWGVVVGIGEGGYAEWMLRSASILLSLLLAAVPAAGTKVYKWVMPDGSIQYSDRPQQEGAEQVELPPLQTFSPPPAPARSAAGSGGSDAAAQASGYERLEVVSPGPDEVVRDNGGTVRVRLALEPPLASGHTVEILLDGKPIGSGRATSASVTSVDRGSHTVSAVIKDEQGNTVASAPSVSFHLKKVSRLLPANPPPAPGSGS